MFHVQFSFATTTTMKPEQSECTSLHPKYGNYANTKRQRNNPRQRRPSKKRHDIDDVTTGSKESIKKISEDGAHWYTKWKLELWSNGQQVFTLHIITVFLRLLVVSDPSSWWVLHPDEVYQSIEVAHSEVYGYGFLPYEFLPPPKTDNQTHLSRADRQEAALGMHSMRSYIYPSLFMLVFRVCQMAGVQRSPVLMTKVFHGFLASHLPLAVYWFTNVLGKSHEAAILAAILVAFSEHLTTFSTHTIICSFLSPFVYGILAVQFKWINENIKDEHTLRGDFNAEDTKTMETHRNGITTANNCHMHKINGDLNGNISSPNCDKHNTHFTTPNISNLQIPEINISNAMPRSRAYQVVDFIWAGMIGFVITALCYIRPDLLLLFTVINVTQFNARKLVKFMSHAGVCSGALVSLLICGYSDKNVYGVWFMSPVQWIKFNVFSKTAGLLFGEEHNGWYFYKILNSSVMFQAQLIIVMAGLSGMLFQLLFTKRPRGECHPTMNMFLTVVVLFTVYSLKNHKEMRFLHNTIVCFHILSALVVCHFIKALKETTEKSKASKTTFKLSIAMLAVFLATNIYTNQRFGLDVAETQRSWLYKDASDSGHVNTCLDFIGRQNDVSGLFLDYCIHTTMGYSILHRDIPIVTLVHDEFYEFDKSVKRLVNSHDLFGGRRNIAVYTFSNPANYITRDNYALLLKYILDNSKYNYVIYGSSLFVELFGFDEVFASGPFKVFRRQENPTIDAVLKKVSKELTKSLNSTLLTYEANWLLTFEQYRRACERLQLAVDIEVTPGIKTLQLLYLAYQKIGEKDKAIEVYKNCTNFHGTKACNRPQPNIKLKSYDNIEAIKKSMDIELTKE